MPKKKIPKQAALVAKIARLKKDLAAWNTENGEELKRLEAEHKRATKALKKARAAAGKASATALKRAGWNEDACLEQIGRWAGLTDADLEAEAYCDRGHDLRKPFASFVRKAILEADDAAREADSQLAKARTASNDTYHTVWEFERARTQLQIEISCAERELRDLRNAAQWEKQHSAEPKRKIPAADLKRQRAARKKLRAPFDDNFGRYRTNPLREAFLKSFTYTPPKKKRGAR